MNKVTVPAYCIKRPALDLAKMKAKLGEILAKYDDFARKAKELDPSTPIKRLACSMEQTAKQIILLYCRKFNAGEAQNGTVKFTYSYLAKSFGLGYRVAHVNTIYRHIKRFMEMPFKFIMQKERSTLGIPGKDITCIELKLDPRVIFYKDPVHQHTQELVTEATLQPNLPIKRQTSWKPPVITAAFPKRSSMVVNKPFREQPNSEQPRRQATSTGNAVGDIMKNMFQLPFGSY